MTDEPDAKARLDFLKKAQAHKKANGPTQTQRDLDREQTKLRKAKKAPERRRRKLANDAARQQRRRDKIKAEILISVAVERPVAKLQPFDNKALGLALTAYIANGSRQGQQLKTRAGVYLRGYLTLLDLRHKLGGDPKPAALARGYADRWGAPVDDWTPKVARMWGLTMLTRLRSLEAPGGPWERDAKAMDPAKTSVTICDGPSTPGVMPSDGASKAMDPDRHAL